MKYDNIIGSPIRYGNLELKNRIIFAPTTMGLREKEYLNKLEEIAKGGCAMIIIGDVPVGKGSFGYSLFSKKGFHMYKRITKRIHKYDCLVCAQLHQNDTHFSGMYRYIPKMLTGKMTPVEIREVMNEQTGNYISSLPAEKVRKITLSFGKAAVKAKEAGFDMIQIHGDRMCGSFSSSLFNKRTDRYGGSLKNRARFAMEAVRAVRKQLPDMSIDYKLAVRQENPSYGKAGVLEEELKVFVPLLEKAGVTSFHVTLANHGKLEDTIPPYDHPEFHVQGCFLKFCDQVRKYTALPVCGVGALSDPDFIEAQLIAGRIDCAAMSRQLIADPFWVKKVMDHKEQSIHKCIRCNKECLGGMYAHKGVHCIYDQENKKNI